MVDLFHNNKPPSIQWRNPKYINPKCCILGNHSFVRIFIIFFSVKTVLFSPDWLDHADQDMKAHFITVNSQYLEEPS